MLDDIKKILEVSNRGIVVMEDGKPSYVVVPFDDYTKSLTESKNIHLLENKRKLSGDQTGRKNDSYDSNLDSIQRVIEKELEFSREEEARSREVEFKERFKIDYEIDRIKKDLREVRLEDLPF
ncbi:MAG: hypothetical protein AAB614_01435 [Patescibacteria group bacterium]